MFPFIGTISRALIALNSTVPVPEAVKVSVAVLCPSLSSTMPQ